MAVSSRPENFFQTTSSIADIERRQRKASNTQGNPLRLPTKLLAIEVNFAFDPSGDVVFVAEAGGTVSAIRLPTNEISRTGKGAQAPIASLAHYHSYHVNDPFHRLDVYAGGWDKSITKYTFSYAPKSPRGRTLTNQSTFKAHNDFVKCLLIAQTADKKPILVSGGADGEINFWTIPENKRLATVKPQARGIECLALDPYSDPSAPAIFISTSQREILTITVPNLDSISSSVIQSTLSDPSVVHETSVYKLHFDAQGDLWTASADKTAKHLVRDHGWQSDTTLQHPDFVRDVVTHDTLPYVVTACRDEEVRVWNSGTGDLLHVFSGHYEEVTGVAISKNLLLSISIDATLRRWSLDPAELSAEIEKAKHPDLLLENPEPNVEREMGMLTEEEEAELNALMEEEDESVLDEMATGT